ncbi:MAG: ATP-binding protein [Candidatus Deferrimicrobiaceae bacterium]
MSGERTRKKVYWVFGFSVLLSVFLFLSDLYKSSDIAVWLLYLIPLLLTSYIAPRWMSLLLLAFCAGLIGLGWFLLPPEGKYDVAILNRLIAACSLGLTIIILLERKRVEDALRESEERYRDLVELSPETIYIQQDGKLVFVNDAAIRLFGASGSAELLGKPVTDFLPGGKNHKIREDLRENQFLEETFVRPGGTVVDVEISAAPIEYEGRPALQVFARDITRRKHLEERLLQSQKIEAVGRLAGGIAHDFNNLMTVITGYVGLTKKRLTNPELVSRGVEEIGKAGERATRLTQQLIAFSRKQVLQPKVLDLNLIVSNLEKMLKRLIGENIELVAIPGANLGKVKADPGQIEQVIVNLALNARDAMPRGGRLTIETANADLDGSSVIMPLELPPGPYLKLVVRDDGTGMDEETKSHIFEPYFTTKDVGKGSGLGLATVYGIVRQSGGDVRVESEPGSGTTFTIWLPRTSEAEQPLEPGEQVFELPRGWETVLVVEDEEPVRNLIRETLEDAGYTVWEASDGEEAISLLSRSQDPVHLILSDVVMPKMGGRDLAERTASLRPGRKVLFMSGYAETIIGLGNERKRESPFLIKPFTPYELTRKVRDVLDG